MLDVNSQYLHSRIPGTLNMHCRSAESENLHKPVPNVNMYIQNFTHPVSPEIAHSSHRQDVKNIPIESAPSATSTPTHFKEESVCYHYKNASGKLSIARQNSNPITQEKFTCIPVEPALLDYLVKHGAISASDSEHILTSSGPSRQLLLLSSLGLISQTDLANPSESSNIANKSVGTGLALLLNALRHTGYHSLASDLDCGRRINPFQGDSSTEREHSSGANNSIPRRRGQLSLWIQLDAIKIDPKIFATLAPDAQSQSTTHTPAGAMLPSSVQYFTLDKNNNNTGHLYPSSDGSFLQHISQPSLWIDNQQQNRTPSACVQETPEIGGRRKKTKRTGCFTKFIRLFRPYKKRKNQITDVKSANISDGSTILCQPPVIDCTVDHPKPIDTFVTAKLAVLENKSSEFYAILANQESTAHDCMVKYLEQTCGVLVLDSHLSHRPGSTPLPLNTGPVLRTITVATQPALVQRLVDTCKPTMRDSKRQNIPPSVSKMATDLRIAVIKSGILAELQVQDIRLAVELESTEVNMAMEELSDCLE